MDNYYVVVIHTYDKVEEEGSVSVKVDNEGMWQAETYDELREVIKAASELHEVEQ